MRRALWCLLTSVAIAAAAPRAYCEIYEVADGDGAVTHYKYTSPSGSIVFTDKLSSIPEGVRRSNRMVRVGPPPGKPASARPQAPESAVAPPPAPSGALAPPVYPVAPVEPQATSGGFGIWMVLLGALVLAAVAAFVKVAASRRGAAPRPAGTQGRGDHAHPAREALPRRHERPPGPEPHPSHRGERPREDPAPPPAQQTPRGEQTPQETLERLFAAREYARAAELCDAQGDPARAADLYLKAGLYAEAAGNFEHLGDFPRAAECHLKAGNPESALSCSEQAADPVRGYAALSGYYYDQGDTLQAALWAEKAGDLVQAATYCQEAGELARAADLFLRAGFSSEAAELFTQLDDLPRAAEALERSGRFLESAGALEKAGGDPERIAGLYERAGEHYTAGRAFVRLGQIDRALNALQRLDVDSPDHQRGSLLVGMIFLKRGLTALAAEKFTKLIDGRPISKGTLEPYYFLALCSEKGGDPAGARAIFAGILAEDHGFRDARKRLEALGGSAG